MAETGAASTSASTATAFESAAPDDGRLPAALVEWMPRQRWFGKGGDVRLRELGRVGLPSPDAAAQIAVHFVLDAGSGTLYQVPLVTRAAGDPGIPSDGRIGYVGHAGPVGGSGRVAGAGPVGGIDRTDDRVLVDASRDAAFGAALMAFALSGQADADGFSAAGVPLGWRSPPPVVVSASLLAGEQSNSSIILELADEHGRPLPPAIVKVFRTLQHGENPDVVLQSAVAAAGSHRVPTTHAAIAGTWRGPAGRAERGHLAVVQEFLAGTEDAWRVALRAARTATDFTNEARALGAATAEVHGVLARALPVRAADDEARAALARSMAARAEQAESLVPEIRERAAAIDAALTAATTGPLPDLQRVHGDLHLGQVLLAPERGWILLDFEGEPLRPMAERTEPDLALRDVAGVLRSFDYVAGSIAQEGGDAAAARTWADAARDAFLAGYAAESGVDLTAAAPLLAALELDKALYECVYEVRNRPDWLPIPLHAVHRLLEAA